MTDVQTCRAVIDQQQLCQSDPRPHQPTCEEHEDTVLCTCGCGGYFPANMPRFFLHHLIGIIADRSQCTGTRKDGGRCNRPTEMDQRTRFCRLHDPEWPRCGAATYTTGKPCLSPAERREGGRCEHHRGRPACKAPEQHVMSADEWHDRRRLEAERAAAVPLEKSSAHEDWKRARERLKKETGNE